MISFREAVDLHEARLSRIALLGLSALARTIYVTDKRFDGQKVDVTFENLDVQISRGEGTDSIKQGTQVMVIEDQPAKRMTTLVPLAGIFKALKRHGALDDDNVAREVGAAIAGTGVGLASEMGIFGWIVLGDELLLFMLIMLLLALVVTPVVWAVRLFNKVFRLGIDKIFGILLAISSIK